MKARMRVAPTNAPGRLICVVLRALGPDALHRRPRLCQRTIDREVRRRLLLLDWGKRTIAAGLVTGTR
jgi:hypothetical protein